MVYRLLRALLLLLLVPAAASAQLLRGTAVDRSGAALPGVISVLLDRNDTVVAKSLSNDRGEFVLRAPREGMYRVRALRIGYRPTVSEPLALLAGAVVTTQLVLDGVRLELATIRVAGTTQCQAHRELALQTFVLWEQVRAALTATGLEANAQTLFATTLAYERRLERSSQRVIAQNVSTFAGPVSQPWRTLSKDSLLKVGYVLTEGDTTTYLVPGLDMLASDEFLTTHCLRLMGGKDTSRIGIAFQPIRMQRHVADIRGTIWLNRNAAELLQIEIGYTNIAPEQSRVAGADIRFARMKNGAWAIPSWSIRMPVYGHRNMPDGRDDPAPLWMETRVSGGILSQVVLKSSARLDTVWSHEPFVLRGIVTDFLTSGVLPGARVTLVGTGRSGVADARGEFTIEGVLPGNYQADVRSSALDTADAVTRVPITVLDSASTFTVRIMSPAARLALVCPRMQSGRTVVGAIVGEVTAATTDEPASGVRVLAQWTELVVRSNSSSPDFERKLREMETRSDSAGSYRLCGVPVDTPVTVRAVRGRATSEPVVVNVPIQQLLVRAALLLHSPR